jgi:hypothetical protein
MLNTTDLSETLIRSDYGKLVKKKTICCRLENRFIAETSTQFLKFKNGTDHSAMLANSER